jgi:hypothetical protein
LVNGTEDRVAPYAQGEIAFELLKDEGYDVTLHSFVGGHTVPEEELGKAVDWLNQQFEKRNVDAGTVGDKAGKKVQASGFFSPEGPPSGPPRRVDAGRSCIVDLEQDYVITGTLSGTLNIDYRIRVDGPCGSPIGTFDEDWIAYGTFTGIFRGVDATASLTYLAHVAAGGNVEGTLVFGQGLSGELTVKGNFADGRLSYKGRLAN